MMTTDRIAIVTGTSSGIGAALTAQLLSRGWDVLGVARRTPAIANPRYRHLALDLSDVPAVVRIVNVSSGAAVHPVPGLAEYCGSKAALRMTGMVLAAELDTRDRPPGGATDVAILSYAPGTVDTPMQATARSHTADVFPSADMFKSFAKQGVLVPPTAPAADIVRFLESAHQPRFAEERLGG